MHEHSKVIEDPGVKLVDATADDLDLINQFTKRKFSADELYVGSMLLCNTEVDRSFERFTLDGLGQFQQTIVGKSLLIGHDHQAAPEGLFFDAAIAQDGSGKKDLSGSDVQHLAASFYLVKTKQNEHLRAQIDGGVYRYVSVGFMYEELTCDICGNSLFSQDCPHIPGREYDVDGTKVTATAVYTGKAEAVEGSIVYLGCQYGAELKRTREEAGLRRIAMFKGKVLEDDIRAIAAEEAQKLLQQGQKPWEETENEIRQRLRDPDDFRDDTFRRTQISDMNGGIWLIVGKLKPEQVPEGHDPDSMVAQSLRFKRKTDEQAGWTLEEAKTWYSEHEEDFKGAKLASLLEPPKENDRVKDAEVLQAELNELSEKYAKLDARIKELEPLATEGAEFRKHLAGEIARKAAILHCENQATTVLAALGEKATAEQLTAIVTDYDEQLAKLPGPVQTRVETQDSRKERVDPSEYS
jgi:hypothetical protein